MEASKIKLNGEEGAPFVETESRIVGFGSLITVRDHEEGHRENPQRCVVVGLRQDGFLDASTIRSEAPLDLTLPGTVPYLDVDGIDAERLSFDEIITGLKQGIFKNGVPEEVVNFFREASLATPIDIGSK